MGKMQRAPKGYGFRKGWVDATKHLVRPEYARGERTAAPELQAGLIDKAEQKRLRKQERNKKLAEGEI
jgi:hypothetical protein